MCKSTGVSWQSIPCFLALMMLWIFPFPASSQVGDKVIPEKPLPDSLVEKPYLQDVTENSIVIVWETTEAVVGAVDYGETEVMENSITESTPTKRHQMKITDLKPGQTYHYRVRYGDVQLDPAKFMTAAIDERVMPEEPMPEGLYIWPYLQNVTQYSIVVMWETTEPVIGVVEYGETAAMGRSVSEPTPATIHELAITGLQPGKTYHYQASYGDVRLEAATFKTSPPDGTREANILLYGDSRSYPRRHRRVVDQMVDFEPDLIINTGDLVSNGQIYEQWKPQHFWPLRILSDHIPVYTCLGNHERNAKHYFNYLSLPGNEVYYSFDYANIHFIALDSNDSYTPYDENSPQYQWLVEDLEKNRDAEWIIVYFHHPLFRFHPGRGIESQRYKWQSLFDKYGVDLVVAGHDHHYGRSRPIGELKPERRNGIIYVTTGGGGASLYPVTEDRPYIASAKMLHNIIKLTVRGDKAEAVVTDIDGNHIETFTMDKNKTTPPDEYIAYEVFEIERDLREAIAGITPVIIEAKDESLQIDETIRIKTSFDVRLEGEMAWTFVQQTEGTDGESTTAVIPATETDTRWTFDSPSTEFAINPGAELRIPLKAAVSYADLYPIPGLTIYFSKIVGRLPVGFRNNQLTFYPIKVLPLLPVTVPRIYTGLYVAGKPTGVRLDGVLDESGWLVATELNSFVTEQADNRPKRTMQVKLVHDGTYLYTAAQIEADPEAIQGILEAQPRTRDDRYIMRGEFFAIFLSPGDTVYGFGVDPQGSQVDSRDNDRSWNLDWAAYAAPTDQGWLVETAIPIAGFGEAIHKKQWSINIIRWDNAGKEAAMLAPTFDSRGTENRLPEYSPSIGDPRLLPPVTFQ